MYRFTDCLYPWDTKTDKSLLLQYYVMIIALLL